MSGLQPAIEIETKEVGGICSTKGDRILEYIILNVLLIAQCFIIKIH